MKAGGIAVVLVSCMSLGGLGASAQDAPEAKPERERPDEVRPPAPKESPPPPSDETPLGFSFGSKPGTRVELAATLLVADWKSRSHFGFDEHEGRGGEVAYVRDLGMSRIVLIPGIAGRVFFGQFGWLGGDFQGFSLSNQVGQVSQPRMANGVALSPGDQMHSHMYFLAARLYYGYDFIYRFEAGDGVPVEITASPYYGVGLIDLDVRTRRQAPTPTQELGGHLTALNVAPGLRLSVDVLDHVRVGLDYGLPGSVSPTNPKITYSERIRVYAGVHFGNVEVRAGWTELGWHAVGASRGSDNRFRGPDFSILVRF